MINNSAKKIFLSSILTLFTFIWSLSNSHAATPPAINPCMDSANICFTPWQTCEANWDKCIIGCGNNSACLDACNSNYGSLLTGCNANYLACGQNCPWGITASAGVGGSISYPGLWYCDLGHSCLYTVTPDACHQTASLTVDGNSQTNVSSYTFTNNNYTTQYHTISSNFNLVDITPPTGSIIINNGATYTRSTSVTLNLTASDACSGLSQMKFSNDNVTWTTPEPFATARNYVLTFGDGTKTVYVKFMDTANNWSQASSDTIILDTTPPTTTVSPAGNIFNVAQTVTLTSSEPAMIYFTTDGTTPTTALPAHTNTASVVINQPTMLKFFAIDTAGNPEAVKTALYTFPSYGGQEYVHCSMVLDPWSCWDSSNDTCDGDPMNLFVCPTGSTKTCHDVSNAAMSGDDNYWNYRTVSCAVPPAGSHVFTLSKTGNGSGTVTSTTAGISCGSDCAEPYVDGTTVTLNAAPATGSIFTGWSGGGCSGTGNCTVTMNSDVAVDVAVTAAFASNFNLTVSKTGTGAGTVTSSPAGITCGSDCSESYQQGTSVTLTATPSSGSSFAGWSGGCSGTAPCVLTMNANKSVTAMFNSPSTYGPWQSEYCDDSSSGSCWNTSGDTCNGDIYGQYTCPGNTNGTCSDVANYGEDYNTYSGWWDYRTVTCSSGT